MLWGDFSSSSPAKLGKLWSMGRVACDMTRALEHCAHVVPYCPPREQAPFSFDRTSAAHREELVAFLRSIDLLWADLYPASTFALMLREELHLPCPAILFAGGVLPKGAEAMLFPWQHLLRPADGLLFSSAADQAIWRRLVTWSKLREWVIPLGVDEAVFYPRSLEERQATRAHHHLPSQAPLLLYVGRLNIQKNLHTLLYLLAAIREHVPDVCLCLVGEEDNIGLGEFAVRNTGYVAWLQQQAANLGMADGVRFLGSLFGENLAHMYSAADVVVNFSLYHRENFGLSQAEAAACGVPVVCSAWGGFKDVVETGVTGQTVEAILTKHGIKVNWARGIRPLVALLQKRTLREEMGKRAAGFARDHFSMSALSQNLAQVVAEVQCPPIDDARPAYQPSLFAQDYEAHKRACGWYASEEDLSWYPPMFQGEAYTLYETLMQPYATQLAQEMQPDEIEAQWVPYFPSTMKVDSLRQFLSDEDPIWPHRRFFTRPEWEVIRWIDGCHTVAAIAQESLGGNMDICTTLLWKLYLEGFILFADSDISQCLSNSSM
jgi:glycosyltransferase involved in cell wall biosynthesis